MKQWGTPLAIGAIILLAGLSTYFATKAALLERKLSLAPAHTADETSVPTPVQTSPTEPTTTATPNPAPSATQSGTTAPTAPTNLSASERIATPAEVYAVQEGDTLYPIGLQHDLAWERIAQANGLVEPFTLSIGQTLAIPSVDSSTGQFEVVLATDPSKAQAAQAQADAGKADWRRSPLATAQAEVGKLYGITPADDFRLDSLNEGEQTAKVVVTRLVDGTTQTYHIYLTQPVTKGETGIWTLSRVVAVK